MKAILALVIVASNLLASARAAEEANPFERVFSLISTQKTIGTARARLMSQLAPVCRKSTLPKTEQYKHGNIECIPAVGADGFSVSADGDGPVGMLRVSFRGAAQCTHVKKVLLANFGKPTTTKGPCSMDWQLKPLSRGGPARYVGFETSTEDDRIHYEIGEEQGP